jgi:hypothetical protein
MKDRSGVGVWGLGFGALMAILTSPVIVETQTRTVAFVFQNNFWLNLHQFVRGEAYRQRVKATPGLDPASLGDADRATWTAAVEAYDDFSKRDVLFDAELRDIDNALSRAGDIAQLPAGVVGATTTKILNAAAPIYRARAWPARQRENDAWNARAKALVERYGAAMSAELARAYRIAWPEEPVLVDAVGEVGPNSAITHDGLAGFSAHTQASAASARNTGDAPLELLFHEAGHVQSVGGRITAMIEAETARQQLSATPDLWHLVMLFTPGVIAKRELARDGRTYQTYGERYPQMPESVRTALQRHWRPWVEGTASFEQALHDLVRDAR